MFLHLTGTKYHVGFQFVNKKEVDIRELESRPNNPLFPIMSFG